jgi:hypothetical protein
MWSSTQIGLLFTMRTYNIFAIPVATYLGQLAELPQALLNLEAQSLRRLTPGPGTWNIKKDLWYLDDSHSFPLAFKSLHFVCWAAKLRTAYFESMGGAAPWDSTRKATQLREALVDTERSRERDEWSSWYQSSFALQLDAALTAAADIGIHPRIIFSDLVRKHFGSGCNIAAATMKAKGEFQRSLYAALLNHPRHKPNHDTRIRRKLKIWKLDIPAGVLSRRYAQNQHRLSGLVQPRVHAACWRAAWNGWCVDYRFRNLSKRWWTKPCVFNCSPTADNRIEHYCSCSHVVRFAFKYLGLTPQSCTLAHFLFGNFTR